MERKRRTKQRDKIITKATKRKEKRMNIVETPSRKYAKPVQEFFPFMNVEGDFKLPQLDLLDDPPKSFEKEIQKVLFKKTFFESLDEESNCDLSIQVISIQDAINKKNIQWIDVRTNNINPEINHSEVLQIPLNDLEQNLNKIDINKEQVLFCQAGIISKKAASILQSHQIHTGFSLKNGAFEVLEYFNNK